MKLVIEPSAGVPTAVALGEQFRAIAGTCWTHAVLDCHAMLHSLASFFALPFALLLLLVARLLATVLY